jgi:zinc transporter 1
VSGAVYFATGFVYADPIVSLLVGFMIIGTAVPLGLRSGRLLLDGVPRNVDLPGVQEDIERITGKFSVHELHIWNLSEYA